MQQRTRPWGCLLAATIAAGGVSLHAGLSHRYSFTADANDSVGTAHGTLMGSASIVGNAVSLDGISENYVNLPADLLKGLSAVTIEAWATYESNAGWARLFDFGDTNPDTGNGRNYLMFTGHSGNSDHRVVISDVDPGYNHEEMITVPGIFDNLGEQHVAIVVDSTRNFMALYVNGKLVGSKSNLTIPLSAVSGVHNYIGKATYNPDPSLYGTVNEFRIYDQALSAAEIAGSAAAGPDDLSLDPGALQSITVTLDSDLVLLGGVTQASTSATFAKAADVPLGPDPGIVYSSSDPAVATIDAQGAVTTVGLGEVTIKAVYGGTEATRKLTVYQTPAVLANRYSFTDASSGVATDSIGSKNGTLMGNAQIADGKLALDGVDSYVDLPNGLVSSLNNVSFVTWATWRGTRMWERIFDFGNNTGGEDGTGDGTTYMFIAPLAGANKARFAVTITGGGAGEVILDAPAAMPAEQAVCYAVVYNASARWIKFYVNGQPVATNTTTIALKSVQDVNVWLGKSNWTADPNFTGDLDEFRIYDGVLTDDEVSLTMAAGPDKLPPASPGPLKSISLTVGNAMLTGGAADVSILADYLNTTGVAINGKDGVTLTSSAPGVVAVLKDSQVQALSAGTAVLTATYQGEEATATINVTNPAGVPLKPVLKHRYSFSEAADSTTVADSIGTAHGTLVGDGGVFSGTGTLDLPGGASGTAAAYVNLPNGIISVLTNATFEAWVTWKGSSGTFWQRIFDFGNNTGGEDQPGDGTTYIFVSPHGGANVIRMGATITGGGAGERITDGKALMPFNEQVHVVASYNNAAGVARLYVNGQLVALGKADLPLASIEDVNNWLGRSNWPDAFFQGAYNEFRIYDGAMLDADVAAAFAAGPDKLPGEGGTPTITAFKKNADGTLTIEWTGGVLQAAPAVTGPWAEVPGATSPYQFTPNQSMLFGRIKQ